MSAQVHSIEGFTPAEIDEAEKMLLERQAAFLSISPEGSHLRQAEIRKFKERNKHLFANPDYPTLAEFGIACDLACDADVANAIAVEAEWQNETWLSAQITKNGDGL